MRYHSRLCAHKIAQSRKGILCTLCSPISLLNIGSFHCKSAIRKFYSQCRWRIESSFYQGCKHTLRKCSEDQAACQAYPFAWSFLLCKRTLPRTSSLRRQFSNSLDNPGRFFEMGSFQVRNLFCPLRWPVILYRNQWCCHRSKTYRVFRLSLHRCCHNNRRIYWTRPYSYQVRTSQFGRTLYRGEKRRWSCW